MDDIILSSSHQANIDYLMQSFASILQSGILAPCNIFLESIEVTKIGPNLHLSQTKYIRDLLLQSKLVVQSHVTHLWQAKTPYQKIQGHLYLMDLSIEALWVLYNTCPQPGLPSHL